MKQEPRKVQYSPQELADLLGYKVGSIYALISRNELSASKSGRRRYISQEQLNLFLQRASNSDYVIDYTK